MKNIEIENAFEQFQKYFPKTEDLTLIILKGHLLIEEQILLLIENRVEDFDAIEKVDLTSFQKICVAKSLVDKFSEEVHDASWLWDALKKLNKLRNDIAHNLSETGIEDRVKDYMGKVPGFKKSHSPILDFEWALLNTVFTINHLIEKAKPEDFEDMT